jgi:hypothetical protein
LLQVTVVTTAGRNASGHGTSPANLDEARPAMLVDR